MRNDPSRPITIIGRDSSGRVIAEDRTDLASKAEQIAAGWRASGMTVEVSHPK